MKITFTLILATVAMVGFQNCSDAAFEISENSGTQALSTDTQQAGNQEVSAEATTTVVEVPEEASTIIPLVDSVTEEIVVQVGPGQTEVLVEIPQLVIDNSPGGVISQPAPGGVISQPALEISELIISQPSLDLLELNLPTNGVWRDIDSGTTSSQSYVLTLNNVAEVPQCATDSRFTCETSLVNGVTTTVIDVDGVLSAQEIGAIRNSLVVAEQTQGYSINAVSRSESSSFVTTQTVIRRVQVLPLINQNIEIPASGGQLLVSVPEGMEEFGL